MVLAIGQLPEDRKTSSLPVAFENLKEYLVNNFEDIKVVAGGREITKRCHYCGDSRDPTSKHLYIGVDKSGKISYHCFKCEAGGVVGPKFFRDLGIYDYNLINLVTEYNQRVSGLSFVFDNYDSGNPRRFYTAPLISYATDDRNLRKLDYINRRLGINLTLPKADELKIILNLRSFLLNNDIRWFSRSPEIVDELDLGFMGFLSMDNSHIVLRRLVPKEKVHPDLRERYSIYKIYPDEGRTYNWYTIPGKIDTRYPCNIIVTEGPFDILSVYMNFPKYRNAIYCSVNGKTNYRAFIKYCIQKLGISLFGTIIHIYSDNDLSERDLSSLKGFLQSLRIRSYLHFNDYPDEKDFGVFADHFLERVEPVYIPEGYTYEDYYKYYDAHAGDFPLPFPYVNK